MPKFRKKPVEIDAVQLTPETFRDVIAFVPIDQFGAGGQHDDGRVYVSIRTLEGTMRADEGDWIIRGVAGEFYPCRDDIFAATYEPVDSPRTEIHVHADPTAVADAIRECCGHGLPPHRRR